MEYKDKQNVKLGAIADERASISAPLYVSKDKTTHLIHGITIPRSEEGRQVCWT